MEWAYSQMITGRFAGSASILSTTSAGFGYMVLEMSKFDWDFMPWMIRYQPSRLPPGFELTGHRMYEGKGQGLYEHLIYSDGLAAVSVYVESEGANSGQSPGMSRLGTTHAYSRHAEDILITVVGDVPPVTVEFIAKAVAPASR